MTVGFRGLCVLLVALPMLVLCVQGRRENSEIDSGFAGDAAVAKRVELPSISLVIITTTRIRISSITASPELKPRFPVPQAAIDCESSVASASAQAASSASRSASGQIQQSVQSAQQVYALSQLAGLSTYCSYRPSMQHRGRSLRSNSRPNKASLMRNGKRNRLPASKSSKPNRQRAKASQQQLVVCHLYHFLLPLLFHRHLQPF